MSGEYHGHMTLADGSHVPLTKDEARAIWKQADEARNVRATMMPTEQDAIRLMSDAFHRLKELGWREAIYCPKDGSYFDVIEPGSSGIHSCHYSGEWPSGSWWIADAGDLWPSRPCLFRLPNEPTEPNKQGDDNGQA